MAEENRITAERLRQILGGQLPFHPLANEWPMMADAELLAMAEDIARQGQVNACCTLGGLYLDGRNRYVACRLAGVEPAVWEYQGPADEDSLRRFVKSLNEHRRHMTPEQLRRQREQRVARVVAARVAGRSIREIAQAEGVSIAQVQRDLGGPEKPPAPRDARPQGPQEESVSPGTPARQGGRDGADGRGDADDQPPRPERRRHGPDAPVTDQLGNAVPAHLRDLFGDDKLADEVARVGMWRNAIKNLDSVRRVATLLPHNPYLADKAEEYAGHLKAAADGIGAAEQILRDSLPAAVCPRCSGTEGGCGHCRRAGWVPRWKYDELTDHQGYEQGGEQP
jgi:hypothetical protein